MRIDDAVACTVGVIDCVMAGYLYNTRPEDPDRTYFGMLAILGIFITGIAVNNHLKKVEAERLYKLPVIEHI